MRDYVESCNKANTAVVSDLCCSSAYRDLGPNPTPNGALRVRLIMHVDSAPVGESNPFAYSACQFAVCELPPGLRQAWANTLVGAIHVGKGGHLDWRQFLSPVDEQLREMSRLGVDVELQDGIRVNVGVDIFFATCDLVARAKLLGMNQFNGCFGCSMCLQRGQRQQNRWVYVHRRQFTPRTSEHYRDFYAAAERGEVDPKVHFGFKPLVMPFPLIKANLPVSCPLDILHLSFEGSLKFMLSTLVLSCKPLRHKFMAPLQVTTASGLLGQITWPTSCGSRGVRGFEVIKFWKAHEFRNFLVALPVMVGTLPHADALNLLCVYCTALWLLTQDVVMEETISLAERLFDVWHKSLSDVMGSTAMRYNAHGHLHLADQARKMGPLWTQATFAFESHLNSAISMLSGKTGFLNQLGTKLSLRYEFGGSGKLTGIAENEVRMQVILCIVYAV